MAFWAPDIFIEFDWSFLLLEVDGHFLGATIFDFTNMKDKMQGRALVGEAVILRAECKMGHP